LLLTIDTIKDSTYKGGMTILNSCKDMKLILHFFFFVDISRLHTHDTRLIFLFKSFPVLSS